MEKIVDYFMSFTGGNFIWLHIRREAIKLYLTYSVTAGLLAIVLSVLISPIIFTIFFFFISMFLLLMGVFALFSEQASCHILKEGSSIKEARYTFYIFIYVGICGVLLTGFTLLNELLS